MLGGGILEWIVPPFPDKVRGGVKEGEGAYEVLPGLLLLTADAAEDVDELLVTALA